MHPHRISLFSLTPSIKTELIRFRLLDEKSVTLIMKKKLMVVMLMLISGGKQRRDSAEQLVSSRVY